MTSNQDDKTTVKHLMLTFLAFAVLAVLLVIGANFLA